MEESIFTKIIKGEIPAFIIREDDRYIAFLDVYPTLDGHTLVVPKKQIDNVLDLDDQTFQELFIFGKTVARALKEVFEKQRVVFLVEGFGVPHVHLHLIPADEGENYKHPNAKNDIDHLKAVHKKIISKIS